MSAGWDHETTAMYAHRAANKLQGGCWLPLSAAGLLDSWKIGCAPEAGPAATVLSPGEAADARGVVPGTAMPAPGPAAAELGVVVVPATAVAAPGAAADMHTMSGLAIRVMCFECA